MSNWNGKNQFEPSLSSFHFFFFFFFIFPTLEKQLDVLPYRFNLEVEHRKCSRNECLNRALYENETRNGN